MASMQHRSMTRVLVVDDYKPWQDVIGSIIAAVRRLQVVGRASDGLEAVHKASDLQPDLILLDIGLPKLNGIEAALQIRRFAPKSRILFLSENRSAEIIDAAMSTGAVGYIVKSNAATQLVPTLRFLRCCVSQDNPLEAGNGKAVVYDEIVDAAASLMRSDFASMQMLFPERGSGGELQLLAFRGFNPEAASFWEWVRADSKSTCGIALSAMRRVVATDIANCDLMADSEDQQIYLQSDIRACQTTPLITPSGDVVGMISTHWRTPHQASVDDYCLFDILARGAAHLLERCEPETARRA
jgi:DNA-binding NarL/FixJ family response regulator